MDHTLLRRFLGSAIVVVMLSLVIAGLQFYGVIDLALGRLCFVLVWIIGTGGITFSEWVWERKVWLKMIVGMFASVVLLIALFYTDYWAKAHGAQPIVSAPPSTSKLPDLRLNTPAPISKGHSSELPQIRTTAQPARLSVFARHDLNKREQEKFIAPLTSQSEPRETISVDCPANDEPDCVYAASFIDLFKAAGWVVDGGVVHRMVLGVPYSGVVLGVHSDAPFDPNQKVGTGHYVRLTPSRINLQQAFANIWIGVQSQSGTSIPEGTIHVYFGPQETEGVAKESLNESVSRLKLLKEALRAMKPAQ